MVAFTFIFLEAMFLFYQLVSLINRPSNTSRIYFIFLLVLLVVYNILGYLAPLGHHVGDCTYLLNILAYGAGFLFACYIPYYFYKGLDLPDMKFHATYGVILFFFAPFFAFIVIEYLITYDLAKAVKHAVVIPFIYSLVVIRQIFLSISRRYQNDPQTSKEVILSFLAFVPWISLPVISYLQMPYHIEVWPTNIGMIVLSAVFIKNDIKQQRRENKLLLDNLTTNDKNDIFESSCIEFKLTSREKQIALLIRKGCKNKDIAEELFISPRTVTTHVRNIFGKTSVTSRIELIRVLEKA